MTAYENLEEKVKMRGVRVEGRLEVLRTLQKYGGGEELATIVDEHERSIANAAKKAREAIR